MAEPPRKRQRTNDDGESSSTPASGPVALKSDGTINVDRYSQDVSYMLNKKYASHQPGDRREISVKIKDEVKETIRVIAEQATQTGASFRMKKSALEILRVIGKKICLYGATALGRTVMTLFLDEECLKEAMLSIAKTFSQDELADIRDQAMVDFDPRNDLANQLVDLQKMSDCAGVWSDFDDVIQLLALPSDDMVLNENCEWVHENELFGEGSGEESYSDESVFEETFIYVYDNGDERACTTREEFENLIEREERKKREEREDPGDG